MSRTEAIPTRTLTHTLQLIAEEHLAYDPYDAVVSLPGIVGTDGLFDYRESVLSLVPQDGYINVGTMWSRNKTAARYALPTKMLQSERAPKKTPGTVVTRKRRTRSRTRTDYRTSMRRLKLKLKPKRRVRDENRHPRRNHERKGHRLL